MECSIDRITLNGFKSIQSLEDFELGPLNVLIGANCPSRRITDVVGAYKKRAHGPIVTSRIGLDGLREKCDHFASWLNRIESIGAV